MIHRTIKLRAQNHAAYQAHTFRWMTEIVRLLQGALGTTNEVLVRLLLHPEMRRIIGQISKNCDEWRVRPSAPETLIQGAVEVRNQRDDQIRFRAGPVFREQIDLRRMVEPDNAVHRSE